MTISPPEPPTTVFDIAWAVVIFFAFFLALIPCAWAMAWIAVNFWRALPPL